MNKVGLIVPALFFVIGAYLLISGVTATEHVALFGDMVTMRSKGSILLGGVGVLGAVAVAVEMLIRTRPRGPEKAVRH